MRYEDLAELFNNWASLKIKLHFSLVQRDGYFKERDIWWVSIGQNIGSEQNGKHRNFERPVLILKKFNTEMFLAVPMSSKIIVEKYRYIFERHGTDYSINLSQMRVLSGKRLIRKMGNMNRYDFENIQKIFQNFFISK